LVRHSELHSIRSNPADATLTLTYAVARRLDHEAQRAFADIVSEHIRAFHELAGEQVGRVVLTCERGAEVTFLHVRRDLSTFTPEELALQVALFEQQFGDTLLRNPAVDENVDDEAGSDEESVELALDALRDPGQRQRMVGVREEKRVLVYFVHPGKRTKVRARS
jgi:hypothetical protein